MKLSVGLIDIRIPLGLSFAVVGALLAACGFATFNGGMLYQRAFDINMNLWVGCGMLSFGAPMLILSKRKHERA